MVECLNIYLSSFDADGVLAEGMSTSDVPSFSNTDDKANPDSGNGHELSGFAYLIMGISDTRMPMVEYEHDKSFEIAALWAGNPDSQSVSHSDAKYCLKESSHLNPPLGTFNSLIDEMGCSKKAKFCNVRSVEVLSEYLLIRTCDEVLLGVVLFCPRYYQLLQVMRKRKIWFPPKPQPSTNGCKYHVEKIESEALVLKQDSPESNANGYNQFRVNAKGIYRGHEEVDKGRQRIEEDIRSRGSVLMFETSEVRCTPKGVLRSRHGKMEWSTFSITCSRNDACDSEGPNLEPRCRKFESWS
ncbi:unnamed protein product [Sphenostylis stenocarpa]|uniref:Uncharacterized protein n=1 Tax=Sphenostylis stenocarpa TaxID=92480 RepID=A0AA86SYD0_9FABA|nr:unnamed protein product [Sphenostylis stenocarpa]